MKNFTNKRVLYLYVIIAITFIVILGLLFTQIAKQFVVHAYEEQMQYDVEYIAEQLQREDLTTEQLQERLQQYKQYFPVDLYYVQLDTRKHLHTFQSNSEIVQKIRTNFINNERQTSELVQQRLIFPLTMSNNEKLILISKELPLQYLSTTIWWITLFLAGFVAVFIWSFGNRLYDNYVEPINKASDIASKLAAGNYKARIHDAPYGTISQLSQSLNSLARNLEYITSKYENQNNRLKTLVNNMESGLLLINEKGITRIANDSFVNSFIEDREDYIGKIYYDVINHAKLNDEIQHVIFLEQKRQLTIETEDGAFFEVYIAPIRSDQKTGKGVVIVCHDITRIKQLENIRKDFVANVSHELRTPITSIQGFSETLLEGTDHSPETVKHFLSIIEKESRRLNALISDLLYLSTLEKEDFQLTKTHFTASHLMDEVYLVVKQNLDEKQIETAINISPSNLEIHADYYRVYQLVLNLFSNAIQYTKKEGRIDWEIYTEQDEVVFKIVDTGIGIPKKELQRVFERFYRVSNDRSRETGGTGLGLSIVKHIVEAHDGHIEIDSELGEGTTIKVFIPQVQI
ncbi:two-component system histidine kinase PnpS [Bacillaceae bacterium W0354]